MRAEASLELLWFTFFGNEKPVVSASKVPVTCRFTEVYLFSGVLLINAPFKLLGETLPSE